MYVCMYACMHMYSCMPACMHMYACMPACMHAYIMYVFMHVDLCTMHLKYKNRVEKKRRNTVTNVFFKPFLQKKKSSFQLMAFNIISEKLKALIESNKFQIK